MGWTLDGVRFEHQGKTARVCADGNNVAWICPSCGMPLLLVYLKGRKGSCASRPRRCEQCLSDYSLEPGYDAIGEPQEKGVKRAEVMSILQRASKQ